MIARVLFDGLWQGALIVGTTALIARCVPAHNATTRCALWFAALAALVLIPLASASGELSFLARNVRAPIGSSSYVVTARAIARDAVTFVAPSIPWFAALWLAGALVALGRMTAGILRVQRIRARAARSTYAADVLLSGETEIPFAAGIIAPVVILPRALCDALTPRDLDFIVAHERAHIRRRDVLWNLVLRVVQALLWFNPWVYVIGREIVRERETACDDWVVYRSQQPDAYAECLASLARLLAAPSTPLLTPSALGSRRALLDRITRIIAPGVRVTPHLNYTALGGTLMLFTVIALAAQSLAPALASGVDRPVTVAAACAARPATVTKPAIPDYPPAAKNASGAALILVSLDSAGRVSGTRVQKSSGNDALDAAAVTAAKKSTYAPAEVNCRAVAGSYLFRAAFMPGPN